MNKFLAIKPTAGNRGTSLMLLFSESKFLEEEADVVGLLGFVDGVIVSAEEFFKLASLLNMRLITYFSWKIFLTSCLAYFLVSLLAIFSSLTTPFRSISAATTYLVGSRWL